MTCQEMKLIKKKDWEVLKRTLLALSKCTSERSLTGLFKVSYNCNYHIFGVRSVKGSSNNVRIAIRRVQLVLVALTLQQWTVKCLIGLLDSATTENFADMLTVVTRIDFSWSGIDSLNRQSYATIVGDNRRIVPALVSIHSLTWCLPSNYYRSFENNSKLSWNIQ